MSTEPRPTMRDFRTGPCPMDGAECQDCSDCPEPILCAVDRARKAVGSATITINAFNYEVSRG